MKQLLLACFTLLFIENPVIAGDKDVLIRMLQDGHTINATNNHEVTLQKAPFAIEVTLINLEGVYLYASLRDSVFNLPDDKPLQGFEDLPDYAMAESANNEDRELLINKEGWSYWFYDKSIDWSRFDMPVTIIDEHTVKGIKSINSIFVVTDNPSKGSIYLQELDQPVYLFFVAIDKTDSNGNPASELKRIRLKINWQ